METLDLTNASCDVSACQRTGESMGASLYLRALMVPEPPHNWGYSRMASCTRKRSGGTREPTGRSVGQVIRATCRKKRCAPRVCLPWLFAADRSDHMESVVKPALNEEHGSSRPILSSSCLPNPRPLLYEVMDLNKTFPIPDVTLF